jgi:ribosome-associated protein
VADGNDRSQAATAEQSEVRLRRAMAAARVADENRGREIVVLDMREQTSLFDFFVLVTGTSRRHLHAISDEIDDALQKQYGDKRMGIEGYVESRWILLDYGDVVVHLFEPETRAYYAIEELWAHAKRIPYPAQP